MLAAPARLSRAFLLMTFLCLVTGAAALAAGGSEAFAASARPHVWIKSPRPHSFVSGSVRCHIVLHDRRGIKKVRFSLDGHRLNTRKSWPYNCSNAGHGRLDTLKLSDGRHRLALRAWNRAGRSRLVRWSFYVANSAQSATAPSPIGSSGPGLLFDGAHVGNFDLVQSAAPNRIQEVPDPLGGGGNALRFRVPDGDVYPNTPTENPRAQALTPNFIKPGLEFWVHDQVMLPSSFPSNLPWLSMLSIYGPPYEASSPLNFAVNTDEIMLKRNGTYGFDSPWRMPLAGNRNRWIDFRLHERFGRDGWIELWIDGKPITFENGHERLYMATRDSSNDTGPNHVTINNYRTHGYASEVTVYHRGFRVGRTSESAGS